MTKGSNERTVESKSNLRMWPVGYAIGILLEVVGFIVLFNSIGRGALGFALIGSGVVFPIVGTILLRQKSRGWRFLDIGGIASLTIALVMLADMYDESSGKYSGGFDAGNGFLFDGLGTLIYIFTVPLFVVIGYVLLIINAMKKMK